MQIRAGVKVELDPTGGQRRALASFAGTARFAYNWGLATRQEHYLSVVKPARERGDTTYALSSFDLINRWNQQKEQVAPWWREVSSQVPVQALLDLGSAFSHFFEGRQKGIKVGFPRFKSKGSSYPSFHLQGPFQVTHERVKIPRLGWIRVAEDPTLRLHLATITSAVLSCHAGRWSIAFAVEKDIPTPVFAPPESRDQILGLDLGLACFAAGSDGQRITAPKPLEESLDQVRALSRSVSRKRNVRDGVATRRMHKRAARQAHQAGLPHWPSKADKQAAKNKRQAEREVRVAKLAALQAAARIAGTPVPVKLPRESRPVEVKSHRQQGAEQYLARLHRTVANRRANFLHPLTTRLAHRGGTVVIENLAVKNLMRNRRLARRIADVGWGEFRRQFTYKCAWYGTRLLVADRFFASSKICSRCGEIKEDLALSDRTYVCGRCGLVIDRDRNAAINLQHYGAAMAAARGESVRQGVTLQDSQPPVVHKRVKSRRPTNQMAVTAVAI